MLGSRCASGHGVGGLGRKSARSLVATLVFVSTDFCHDICYLLDSLPRNDLRNQGTKMYKKSLFALTAGVLPSLGLVVTGAALLGTGWGLEGYCQEPGFASLLSGGIDADTFVAALLVGMWTTKRWLV